MPSPGLAAADLLSRVTTREPLVADDGKSGNSLERIEVDGTCYVVKHQSVAGDWLTRLAGDPGFWVHQLWQSGLMAALPPSIDHAVVDMVVEGTGPSAALIIVMDDVSDSLIPEGDDPISVADHAGLIESMAGLHATFWGWHDDLGLQSLRQRVAMFAPETIAPELRVDDVPVPVRFADEGWRRLPDVAPALASVVLPLHTDPTPLLDAWASTPTAFLHGDWKMGNLGRHPDGRTILLDWAYLGAGPVTWDLCWYLALNRARLPETKEQTIERYRLALETHEVATDDWFDRQLGLSLLGMMCAFGWEKALGDATELAWWEARVIEASPDLDRRLDRRGERRAESVRPRGPR